jgi:hypothetical protein
VAEGVTQEGKSEGYRISIDSAFCYLEWFTPTKENLEDIRSFLCFAGQ